MKSDNTPLVGIDDIAAYIPQLYLPIESLAEARGIEYAKLNKGLGLTAMAVPNVGEDASTMMANAVRLLIEKNDINPSSIGRLYLGTESAIDGAKPTATYALQMLQAYFSPKYGEDCFLNCDVVDMTFACIGAVDALQNTLDWTRAQTDRIGIIVASDNAKYELDSTGEYTQGAGSVAVLVKQSPRLLAIDANWGIATRAVYDFYKPLRHVKKADILAEAMLLLQQDNTNIATVLPLLEKGTEVTGILDSNEKNLVLHKETPIFDGPYSNECYQERIKEALHNYKYNNKIAAQTPVSTGWDRLVFHLPYAFQARRMFGEIFWQENQHTPLQAELEAQIGMNYPNNEDFDDNELYLKAKNSFWRAITKTPLYRSFVTDKVAPGEQASSLVGNMYAGSILLSIMSTLEVGLTQDTLKTKDTLGFFAYGSGSKSKVFTGQLQSEWKEVVKRFNLFGYLNNRTPIDYQKYEQLHRKALPLLSPDEKADYFYLTELNDQGIRNYHIPTQA